MSILAFFETLMGGDQEPVDVEADAIIRAFLKRQPEAAYRVTKLAMARALQPAPVAVQLSPAKPRNWLSTLLDRRGHFAS